MLKCRLRSHTYALSCFPSQQPDIADPCPWCNLHPPLGIDLLRHHRDALRELTDELFLDGQPLAGLYHRIFDTGLHNLAMLNHKYDVISGASGQGFTDHSSPEPTAHSRQGIVLTYLAQAARNHMTQQVCTHNANKRGRTTTPQIVVTCTVALVGTQPRFYFAANGHDRYLQEDWPPLLWTWLPRLIDGVPCGCIIFVPPQEADGQKRLQMVGIENVSSWSFHAEQKMLREIKAMSETARATVTCMGIAHCMGPCTVATAGVGTNQCAVYLERKFTKDMDSMYGGGAMTRTVSAYWYGGAQTAAWAQFGEIGIDA